MATASHLVLLRLHVKEGEDNRDLYMKTRCGKDLAAFDDLTREADVHRFIQHLQGYTEVS